MRSSKKWHPFGRANKRIINCVPQKRWCMILPKRVHLSKGDHNENGTIPTAGNALQDIPSKCGGRSGTQCANSQLDRP